MHEWKAYLRLQVSRAFSKEKDKPVNAALFFSGCFLALREQLYFLG
jgi:hypothetical protein